MKVDSNIISDAELIEFLQIDLEDEEEYISHQTCSEIQVCAGTWRRYDGVTWYFDPDPEWDA